MKINNFPGINQGFPQVVKKLGHKFTSLALASSFTVIPTLLKTSRAAALTVKTVPDTELNKPAIEIPIDPTSIPSFDDTNSTPKPSSSPIKAGNIKVEVYPKGNAYCQGARLSLPINNPSKLNPGDEMLQYAGYNLLTTLDKDYVNGLMSEIEKLKPTPSSQFTFDSGHVNPGQGNYPASILGGCSIRLNTFSQTSDKKQVYINLPISTDFLLDLVAFQSSAGKSGNDLNKFLNTLSTRIPSKEQIATVYETLQKLKVPAHIKILGVTVTTAHGTVGYAFEFRTSNPKNPNQSFIEDMRGGRNVDEFNQEYNLSQHVTELPQAWDQILNKVNKNMNEGRYFTKQ